jgi:hypothetical protein
MVQANPDGRRTDAIRVIEPKHLRGRKYDTTMFIVETPADDASPSFPAPRPNTKEKIRQLFELADSMEAQPPQKRTIFCCTFQNDEPDDIVDFSRRDFARLLDRIEFERSLKREVERAVARRLDRQKDEQVNNS